MATCGACSILVNGEVIDACLMMGVEAEGQELTTIEGVASAGWVASSSAEISRTRSPSVRDMHAGLYCGRQGIARSRVQSFGRTHSVIPGGESVAVARGMTKSFARCKTPPSEMAE